MSRKRRPRRRQARGGAKGASNRTRGGGLGRFGRWFARLLAGISLLALVLAAGLFLWSFFPGEVLGSKTETFHFQVSTGDKGAVVDALAAEGRLKSPGLTRAYVTLLTPFSSFVPRSHLLVAGASPRALVRRLSEAGSRARAQVTFPEGWTHLDMAQRLEKNQICSELGFQAAVVDEQFVSSLGIPARSAEGYLFPARYELAVDSDPRDVVKLLVKEARKRFARLREKHHMHQDLVELGFDEQDIFTLASIVQRETSLASESPRVARVFINRLLQPDAGTGGRLQSDPTAAYGCRVDPMVSPVCSRFTKKVTPELLKDEQNPYNTYRHSGLPPGPISNPGEEAIAAVLSPAEGAALYFVADGSGGHTFSQTYEEHLEAVKRLRKRESRDDP